MANLRAKDFDFGVPKVLALKAAGQSVEGQYGVQVRFATATGDSLYLDESPAGDLMRGMQELGIRYGEDFVLRRAKTSHGGSRFIIERQPVRDAGGHNVPERHAETFGARMSEALAPAQRTAAPESEPSIYTKQTVTPTSAKLLAAYMIAIDTLVESQVYAQRKGLMLTIACEDVRCLAALVLIDNAKGGGR